MNPIRTIVCVIFVGSLFLSQRAHGQFVPYSQYYNAPLLTNPATPALTDYMQVNVQYRTSRVAHYDIPSVSFLMPFYRQSDGVRYGGMGVNVISQSAGPNGLYKVTGATGTFAYNIHLSSNHHIGAGISGGIINKRIDASGITTDSQYNLGMYDPSLNNGENIQSNSVTRPVINAGLRWMLTDADDQERASLGVAAYSMNRPSFDLLSDAEGDKTTYVISGEVALPASERVTVSPTFRYIYQGTSAANIGARLSYALDPDNALSAGLWYKTTKALVVSGQYNYKAYTIGASMDFSMGSGRDANVNNAFEIALGWRMNRKEKLKSRKTYSNTSSTSSTTTQPAKEESKEDKKDEAKDESSSSPAKDESSKPANTETAPAEEKPVNTAPPAETQKPEQTLPPAQNPANSNNAAPQLPPPPPMIPFEPGSNEVSEASEPELKKLAETLKAHPEYKLKITGHSCALGDRPTRQQMSDERAQAVAKVLIANGVPKEQLEVSGMSDRKPIASNRTKAGRKKNRRVELEWIKK